MPRKKATTSTSMMRIGGVDILRTLQDAKYVIKWNAPLALAWMHEALARLQTGQEVRAYNTSVRAINGYLDSLERTSYYDKTEVWGPLAPTRLELTFNMFLSDEDELVDNEKEI